MSSFVTKGRVGLALAAVGALSVGLMAAALPAQADPAPRTDDVVGVGSDTLQYMLDFGADGDGTNAGYNFGKTSRIMSFDATPDANARAGYLNGSSASGLKPLNPTIVLRGGAQPVQRPNGSGAGLKFLQQDTAHQVDFVRSSSALTTGNTNSQVGSIHEVRLATDGLHVATATSTNAPALSNNQLKQIYLCNYTTWGQVGVTGAAASSTIIPIIPQLGSGTRKTFLQDLGFTIDSSGNSTPALGGCVKPYEENDPYALYVDDSGNQVANPYASGAVANANAIEPISDGRLALYSSGYFLNPNVAPNPNTTTDVLKPGVKLDNTGSPSDTNPVYSDTRGLYVFFRESDVSSTTKFNGSSTNWVHTLFLGSSAFFASTNGQALLMSAGVKPSYADCGTDSTSASTCQ